MNNDKVYVTKEGLEKLKNEYEDLTKNKRKEVIERIKLAKAHGDLSENAEYEAAKNQQAFMEGRIDELESILRDAEIIDENTGTSSVQVGSTVKVKISEAEHEYRIVGSNEADPVNGLISNESPIGASLLGAKKGDCVKVATPDGEKEYEILSIS